MNGEPLRPDHGAPFRIIVPHWFAVASVKWLHRIDVLTEPYVGEFQTGHYIYEWPDRPHEPVTLMRVRARITDPAPGAVLPLGTHTVRGKAWSGTGPITHVDVSLTGEGDWHPATARATQRPLPVAGLVVRLDARLRRQAHPARPGDRRRRQRPTRGPTVEPARLRQQRHRGPLRRHRLTIAERRCRPRTAADGADPTPRHLRHPSRLRGDVKEREHARVGHRRWSRRRHGRPPRCRAGSRGDAPRAGPARRHGARQRAGARAHPGPGSAPGSRLELVGDVRAARASPRGGCGGGAGQCRARRRLRPRPPAHHRPRHGHRRRGGRRSR